MHQSSQLFSGTTSATDVELKRVVRGQASAGRAAGGAAGRAETRLWKMARAYLTTHNNSPNQTSQNKPTKATAPQTSKHFTIQATQLTQKSCQNVLTSQLWPARHRSEIVPINRNGEWRRCWPSVAVCFGPCRMPMVRLTKEGVVLIIVLADMSVSICHL